MLHFSLGRLAPVVCALALTATAAEAAAFEGELVARLAGQPGTSLRVHAWYSSGGDVRIDTSGKGPDGTLLRGSTIMPSKGDLYYSISHNQKVIVEVPYEDLRGSSADVAKRPEADLEVERMGQEVVSGVETQHVRVLDKDNNAVIDLWMTPKYPPDLWTQAFRGRNVGLELSDEERMKAMRKYGIEPGFAMKMRVHQAGRPPVEFVVESIKRGTVAPTQFSLPTGYKRVQGGTSTPQRKQLPAPRPNP